MSTNRQSIFHQQDSPSRIDELFGDAKTDVIGADDGDITGRPFRVVDDVRGGD